MRNYSYLLIDLCCSCLVFQHEQMTSVRNSFEDTCIPVCGETSTHTPMRLLLRLLVYTVYLNFLLTTIIKLKCCIQKLQDILVCIKVKVLNPRRHKEQWHRFRSFMQSSFPKYELCWLWKSHLITFDIRKISRKEIQWVHCYGKYKSLQIIMPHRFASFI